MTRKLYVMRDLKLVEVGGDIQPSQTPFVHDDSMPPLRHLVSGQIFDSKSKYLAECRKHNVSIVGNDLLSKQKHELPDRLTDAKVMDAVHKAESIMADPSKLRARMNENLAILERRERLLNGR